MPVEYQKGNKRKSKLHMKECKGQNGIEQNRTGKRADKFWKTEKKQEKKKIQH